MQERDFQPGVTLIPDVMDLLGVPAFLLDVDGPGQFRFAHLNTRHILETGVETAGLIGRRPHEVLPQRLADTVVANYEQCRLAGDVVTYDEELQLGGQTRWWRTTLSPWRSDEDGRVCQIIGSAVDITSTKTHQMELTKALSAQIASADAVRSFVANAMLDSQGPMRAVLAWLDILRDGFVDLGDGKLEEMDRVQQLAIDAIVGMDEVLHSDSFASCNPASVVTVDLAHVCRDIAALVDPAERLKMCLPNCLVEADWATTQIVLRCLLEQATQRAVSEITVAIEEAGSSKFAIVITDDSALDKGLSGWMGDTSTVASVIKQRGGELTMSSSLEGGACVRAILPGRLSPSTWDASKTASTQARRASA